MAKTSKNPSAAAPIGQDGASEFDVREDEEQNVKLVQISDLLLAAGYFRARIKGLSSFDKVVGGMVWCITICSYEVDVDLLFQENSHIGQKIALTEKVVGALKRMKCPHRIEPHQIQGLDFIHIYPVIQWLVKRAIETKAEMGDYNRAYSVSQFSKTHSLPEDIAYNESKDGSFDTVNSVLSTYRPQRKFRRTDSVKIKEEESRVQTTLLEYGRRYAVNKTSDESSNKKQSQEEMEEEQRKLQEEDERRIESLMQGMMITKSKEGKLTASSVGTLVGLQSDQIQQVVAEFAEKQAELSEMERSSVGGQGHMYHRQCAALQKEIQQEQNKISQIEQKHAELKSAYEEILKELNEAKATNENLDSEIQRLTDIEEQSGQSHLLKELQEVMELSESLKKKESEFKDNCRKEKEKLENEIKDLEKLADLASADASVLDSFKTDHDRAVDEQYEAYRDKVNKVRLLLARKNREIATLQRKIDEVPTRAELNQYQQRFVELYSQVTSKHKETKQFYTLYNTLEDTRVYLTKEVTLLNSINDTFEQAMASASNKEQFLKQFEAIVDGVKQNRDKIEKRKQEEKMRRDQLNDEYLSLVEKQRQYSKAVKDFQEECRKHEILQSKISENS